jgi:hypothetical protein
VDSGTMVTQSMLSYVGKQFGMDYTNHWSNVGWLALFLGGAQCVVALANRYVRLGTR